MSSFSFAKEREYESVLSLIGLITAFLAILPFGIYRFLNGDYVLAAVDSLVAIILAIGSLQAWKLKHTENINLLLTLAYMGGLFAVLHLRGTEVFLWIYPAIVATYFTLPANQALPVNILCIIATYPVLTEAMDNTMMVGIFPTLIMVCIFGYIFSARSEHQNRQLSQLVSEDPLTNTENRRSLDIKLDEIVANFGRSKEPVSMLMLDLDHFKKINDTYGHSTGDKILVNFSHLIKANIRITDRLYRFGGEEFILIANNTDIEDAGKLAEFLRKLIKNDPMLNRYQVTVSIGVAQISQDDNPDSWLHRTDIALYEAKEMGRNATCIAKQNQVDNTYHFIKPDNFAERKPQCQSDSKIVSLDTFTHRKKYEREVESTLEQ